MRAYDVHSIRNETWGQPKATAILIGPFTRVAQQHVEAAERPTVRTPSEQPIGSTSLGRQVGATIHSEPFHLEADPIKPLIDLSAILMRWSSISDGAFTRSGVQPVSIDGGDCEIRPKPCTARTRTTRSGRTRARRDRWDLGAGHEFLLGQGVSRRLIAARCQHRWSLGGRNLLRF